MMEKAPASVVSGESQRGFTLVEVLAGLALTSLILVALNLAVMTILKGVEKTRQNLGSQTALSVAVSIFQRDAARIAKLRRTATPRPGPYLFEGNAKQLIYPLSENESASQSGFYLVRLSVADGETATRLVRERMPLRPGEAVVESRPWDDTVVLLEGPFDITFAYRAQRTGARSWSDSWPSAGPMPEQLRLTIVDRATGRLRVPVIVQSLHVDAEIECAANDTVCGEEMPGSATP